MQILSIDQSILVLVPGIRTSELTSVFKFFTFLAGWQMIVIIASVTFFLLIWLKQRFSALIFATTLAFAELIGLALKELVARPRPNPALSIATESSYSFPSGHTLAATVIFGMIAYFLTKSVRLRLNKFLIFLIYAITVVAVGLSRIYLGVHYPSDVVASLLLGALIMGIFVASFTGWFNK